MSKKDWETDGTRNGTPVYCTVNGLDCPYYGEGLCHIADPIADCDDFAAFFESWEDWESCDNIPDDVDETGYDPYLGCYTEEC